MTGIQFSVYFYGNTIIHAIAFKTSIKDVTMLPTISLNKLRLLGWVFELIFNKLTYFIYLF